MTQLSELNHDSHNKFLQIVVWFWRKHIYYKQHSFVNTIYMATVTLTFTMLQIEYQNSTETTVYYSPVTTLAKTILR